MTVYFKENVIHAATKTIRLSFRRNKSFQSTFDFSESVKFKSMQFDKTVRLTNLVLNVKTSSSLVKNQLVILMSYRMFLILKILLRAWTLLT